jgi:hypothetical protein
MTTERKITGLLRKDDGTLEYVTFRLVDGVPCDGLGQALVDTYEDEQLLGWAFAEARVYRTDAGREVLFPADLAADPATNLAELMGRRDETCALYDAHSGAPLVPADDPADYEVLKELDAGDPTFAAVRGPSGQLDVYGPHPGMLHRDALNDPDDLAAWVEANYPGN